MRGGRRRLGYALLLAVGLHLDLLLLFGVLMHGAAGRVRVVEAEESIGVETIDPEAARQLLAELDREQAAEEEKKQEEEAEKEREATKAPGQVVQLPQPAKEERPRDAKYVAEHDSKVEKETKKQGRYDDRSAAPPPILAMRSPSPAEPSPPGSPGSPGSPQARRNERPKPPAPEAPPAPTPALPDPDGIHPLQPGLPQSPREPEEMAGAGKRAPGNMPLTPNSAQLAQAIGGGTQDHLPDVDDGANTALNAKGWKFASFFNRIKRQVAQHWRPADQYEKRDPTGHIYGSGQWVTMLHVSLKPDGSLSGVSVAKPSGLEFLDDEAIEAIKRASPYPNPPSQLVGDDGMIAFKFGFFFDVDGGPRMKVYRYSGL
jgi:TonB family protein